MIAALLMDTALINNYAIIREKEKENEEENKKKLIPLRSTNNILVGYYKYKEMKTKNSFSAKERLKQM